MKKRVISVTLVLVMVLSLCVPAMAANIRTVQTDITYRGISIVINGVEIAPCDESGASTEPFIMNDTTYLPVRAIAGALGLNVGWEPSTSTVVLESGGEANYGNGNPSKTFNVKRASITYRGTNISLDGKNIPLVNRNGESVEPFIYNGTNYLPLRVVSEALGLNVGWDGATSTVTLTKAGLKGYWAISKQSNTVSADGYYFNQTYTYTYDRYGRISSENFSDSDGKISGFRLSYHPDGSVAEEDYYDSTSEDHSYSYDTEGKLISETVGDWSVSEYEYDEMGNLLLKTTQNADGSSNLDQYSYDAQGRQVLYTNNYYYENELAYWNKTEYIWDGNSCLERFTDCYENVYEYQHDYTYDAHGRAIKENVATIVEGERTNPYTKEYKYLDDGTLYYTKNYNEHETHLEEIYEYDDLGRLTGYYYYINGNITQETYVYDDLGRLIEETYSDTEKGYYINTNTFDAQGNLTENYYEENGSYVLTTTEYDAKGRVTGLAVDNNGVVLTYTCTHDGNGNLIRAEAEYEGAKSIVEYGYVFIVDETE